jgi:hypothetical protein
LWSRQGRSSRGWYEVQQDMKARWPKSISTSKADTLELETEVALRDGVGPCSCLDRWAHVRMS